MRQKFLLIVLQLISLNSFCLSANAEDTAGSESTLDSDQKVEQKFVPTPGTPLQGRADLNVQQYGMPNGVPSLGAPPTGVQPLAAPYAVPNQYYVPYQQQNNMQDPFQGQAPYVVPSQPGYLAPQQPGYMAPQPGYPAPGQLLQQEYQQSDVPPPPPGVKPLSSLMQGTMEDIQKQDPRKSSLFGNALKSLLLGGTAQPAPPAVRPWWIPGHAYTNDYMVAPYHNMDIRWWDKRPMPDKPQMVRLATSVTRFWKGQVSEPCMVLVKPFAPAPGNFTFASNSPMGPRGWLQALNQADPSGYPQYRYWLDQP